MTRCQFCDFQRGVRRLAALQQQSWMHAIGYLRESSDHRFPASRLRSAELVIRHHHRAPAIAMCIPPCRRRERQSVHQVLRAHLTVVDQKTNRSPRTTTFTSASSRPLSFTATILYVPESTRVEAVVISFVLFSVVLSIFVRIEFCSGV